MNVLFHISDVTRWDMTLTNIKSLRKQATIEGTMMTIELVVNGEPVEAARRGSAIQLTELVEDGVTVAICNNAMNAHDMTPEDLQPGLIVVPAAVYEIALRQAQGYGYIKP